MNDPNDYLRIDSPSDPERCQHVGKNGQCLLKRTHNTDYCMSHGKKPKANNDLYRTKWRAQIQSKINENEDIYDLTEEIGILRLTLESLLSKCEDSSDLVLNAGPISDLILKIERLVAAFHKIRVSNGNLLDKTAVLRFSAVIINILSEQFSDQPEKLNIVAEQILGATNDKDILNTSADNSN